MSNIKFDFWLISGFFAFVLLIAIFSYSTNWIDSCFAPYVDPIIGIGTFATAIIIAYRGWKDKIPKKLTIHFKYEGKYVFTCHRAYLSGEGDMRPWGQQIGRQMNGGKSLDFYPYIDQKAPKVEEVDGKTGRVKDKNSFQYVKWLFSDRFYKHYVVTFFLYKPAEHNDSYTISWDNSTNTPDNKGIRIEKSDLEFEITEAEAEAIAEKAEVYQNDNTMPSTYEIFRHGKPVTINLENVSIIKQIFLNEEVIKKDKKMIINFSNHPSSGWSDAQKKAAEETFGEIQDMPFPNIRPTSDTEELDALVKEYLNKIVEMQPVAVHIAGEPVFVFRLVSALKAEQIKCVSSTTERMVHEEAGKKISVFQFVNFREF